MKSRIGQSIAKRGVAHGLLERFVSHEACEFIGLQYSLQLLVSQLDVVGAGLVGTIALRRCHGARDFSIS
jgi:hypothetical protein